MTHNLNGEEPFFKNSARGKFFLPWRGVAAFFVLVCLSVYALGANPFAGQTVAPLDLLMAHPGWSTVQTHHTVVHSESTDIIDSQLPAWITLKAQIRAGQGALWWPYGTGGQPVANELFNPAFLLFLSVKDNALAYYLVCLAKLVISGFGAYLLLSIFLRWLPSLWGGFVYMLCGFNAAWFFWDHVVTAMWIPWLLWAAVRYLRTDDTKWLPVITLISLLLIFGAFPPVAAFGFYSFGLLILIWNGHGFFSVDRRSSIKDKLNLFLKKSAFPMVAVAIGFLLSSVVLFSLFDSLSGINLSYRIPRAKTLLQTRDLLLLFFHENPSQIERTVYIGIPAFILALTGVFSAYRTTDGNLKLFTFFNTALVIITILIAFGLLPHELIRAIPVFNSHNWGRLMVVPLLGFAVLSSIGINFLLSTLPPLFSSSLKISPQRAHQVLTVLLVGIMALQFHFQKKLFNSFNAVVPSSWLYPRTPSIDYVKDRLKPLQSVIADDSYSMSGTLVAYGIPQWYAHGFRTDKEKEVLGSLVRDPFPSATSSLIYYPDILFDSPLMDKLAIKYVLVNKDLIEPITDIVRPAISNDQAPPLPDNSWRQHIYVPDDKLISYFRFLPVTYGEEYAPANLRLDIYKDGGNTLFAQAELGKHLIGDNKIAEYKFPHKVLFTKGGYSLVLSLAGYQGPGKLSAQATKYTDASGSYLEVNGLKSDISLKWNIGVSEGNADRARYDKKWNIIDLERDVVIFENKQVTNSAYFIKDLSSDSQIDFSGLDVMQPSAELINIRYSNRDPGWIVLPMHLDAGWQASVDGRRVTYDAYLGILPAIPVSGASQVSFRYDSRSFKTGGMLSLAGILVFAIFTAYCVKIGNRKMPKE